MLNLFAGMLAVLKIFEGDLVAASWLVGIAALFDFLDGLAARILRETSELGKQLDSLADVVSFGLVPGLITYELMIRSDQLPNIELDGINVLALSALMIPVFSAIRLAKFNTDIRQKEYFIGLPVPANALFFASLPLIYDQRVIIFGEIAPIFTNFLHNTIILVSITLFMSLLMVSNLPLISLKFTGFDWGVNKNRYIFVIISLILIALLYFLAIPLIIFLYLLTTFTMRKM
ncbi:MAG: CDP-diacylglycerol--serine O-phosphatidyltransferase [Bacteroidales bacterium]|nr:CDP-diacylglycerol--serine O-phosphatidyltransferase [Bacteroidales bacterium]